MTTAFFRQSSYNVPFESQDKTLKLLISTSGRHKASKPAPAPQPPREVVTESAEEIRRKRLARFESAGNTSSAPPPAPAQVVNVSSDDGSDDERVRIAIQMSFQQQ